MSRKTVQPLFAVIRVDWFQLAGASSLDRELVPNLVTVKEVLTDLESAEAEVARLNALQVESGVDASYFVQQTRLVDIDPADG